MDENYFAALGLETKQPFIQRAQSVSDRRLVFDRHGEYQKSSAARPKDLAACRTRLSGCLIPAARNLLLGEGRSESRWPDRRQGKGGRKK